MFAWSASSLCLHRYDFAGVEHYLELVQRYEAKGRAGAAFQLWCSFRIHDCDVGQLGTALYR